MKIPRKISFALLIPALAWSCGGTQQKVESEESATVEAVPSAPSLTKVWETTEELTTNESALYDASSGIIYIANIDGDSAEKDGKGFISKISKTGEIIEKEWVKGLDAPKGMGIVNGTLYVTNIDELVEINLTTGKISKRHKIEGAQFLNDLDTSGDKVFFTDMNTGKIHVFQNGSFSLFAENQTKINGIRIAEDGTVFGLDAAGLKKYNSDGSFEILNSNVTGGDGLIILEDNVFLASRWQGEIYLIKDGIETLLLDTKAEESNTADIGYIPSENLVLVPTFFKNKVVAYKLDY
ncbi:ATP-binding protein [Aquiflexum sp. TKW24L]|uniref:ATP-binding protein n=1 Tax=Aquiflexum sp. TKW24L TaxID=2942212 RepID=UPI0020BFB95A|nr:ATP-binding protein [Aquiflexum sp. TKW24L]MCL6260700.1 ATP-binding protein [Aquiflexum sp. TKW24L]